MHSTVAMKNNYGKLSSVRYRIIIIRKDDHYEHSGTASGKRYPDRAAAVVALRLA